MGNVGFRLPLQPPLPCSQELIVVLSAKDAPFDFIDECLDAFHTLKKALISTPIIQPLDWTLPFEIMCDASDYAVGDVLG